MSKKLREEQLDFLSKIQKSKYSDIGDPEILSRISQYEMAFRMQTSVPDVMIYQKNLNQFLNCMEKILKYLGPLLLIVYLQED